MNAEINLETEKRVDVDDSMNQLVCWDAGSYFVVRNSLEIYKKKTSYALKANKGESEQQPHVTGNTLR